MLVPCFPPTFQRGEFLTTWHAAQLSKFLQYYLQRLQTIPRLCQRISEGMRRVRKDVPSLLVIGCGKSPLANRSRSSQSGEPCDFHVQKNHPFTSSYASSWASILWRQFRQNSEPLLIDYTGKLTKPWCQLSPLESRRLRSPGHGFRNRRFLMGLQPKFLPNGCHAQLR